MEIFILGAVCVCLGVCRYPQICVLLRKLPALFGKKPASGLREHPAFLEKHSNLPNMTVTRQDVAQKTRDWENTIYYKFILMCLASVEARSNKLAVIQALTHTDILPQQTAFLRELLDATPDKLLEVFAFGTFQCSYLLPDL